MCLLELKNMSYRCEGEEAEVLRNVSASFEGGKVYAVMGKPGCGKTTLLALLAGLDACTGGEIRYQGQDMKDIDRDEYRAGCIGTVFQSCNLIASTTALENIVLSLGIRGDDAKGRREKAYALLLQAGLGRDAADSKVSRFAPAEQQRAALARALAHDPCILLADEPTGSLGTAEEADILKMLSCLAHEHGKCVIITTSQKKVASSSDELWALADGRMLLVR